MWRFFGQMIIGTIYSLACLNISYLWIKRIFTEAPPIADQFVVMNVYGMLVLFPIYAFVFGIQFLKAWRKSEIESERLQKENARSQMMSLRNHLDPHFLFNNLNILSSLMSKDIDLSRQYLDRFAEVYRIILRSEQSDLCTLEEEMKLVNSYIFLIKTRFDQAIKISINIEHEALEKVLPPLSVQMLIENAIKHNTMSKSAPIHIEIDTLSNDYLCVKNNVREKKYGEKKRKGTGLNNIMQRYRYFTEKAVIIHSDEQKFSIDLPLLTIEN